MSTFNEYYKALIEATGLGISPKAGQDISKGFDAAGKGLSDLVQGVSLTAKAQMEQLQKTSQELTTQLNQINAKIAELQKNMSAQPPKTTTTATAPQQPTLPS